MKAFVGVTDYEWFDLLSSIPTLDEVNFWQPSGNSQFKALLPGELFLFKLHSPNNFIVGGGFFAHSSLLPISLAWESFEQKNGAQNLSQMRHRVAKYRRVASDPRLDYTIGCILIEQPFFLPRPAWIPVPSDWASNIVRGRGYDLTTEPGLTLWQRLQHVMPYQQQILETPARYGAPTLTIPRLGQGSFRVLVTDAYERRCAVTRERTLPALDAAHIKPYAENGPHSVNNGLLLRRDLHSLFDKGYMTISPDLHIEISRKIKEEFENGKEYYRYNGEKIYLPGDETFNPSPAYLEWHNDNVFRV